METRYVNKYKSEENPTMDVLICTIRTNQTHVKYNIEIEAILTILLLGCGLQQYELNVI